jgi:hypothetical protein
MMIVRETGRRVAAVAAVAVAAVVVAGCNDPGFRGVEGVRSAEANEVAACRYVSGLRMTPSVYGPLADEGLRYVRNKIMSDAKSLGANTVVFEKVTPGLPVGEVRADAYSC